VDLWLPSPSVEIRANRRPFPSGRLKGGVESARTEPGRGPPAESFGNYPPAPAEVLVLPLADDLVAGEAGLMLLLGAVGFVLLIACANAHRSRAGGGASGLRSANPGRQQWSVEATSRRRLSLLSSAASLVLANWMIGPSRARSGENRASIRRHRRSPAFTFAVSMRPESPRPPAHASSRASAERPRRGARGAPWGSTGVGLQSAS
jgi:hypothetical protein